MKPTPFKKFFTLIELLVVIAIIGVIISISFVSFSNIRQKSRDTQRISDIKLLQKALEDYHRTEGSYPASLTPGEALVGTSSGATYIQVPQNPAPRNDGDCPDSEYLYKRQGDNYNLDFCLSEKTAQIDAGRKCANPQGILNEKCFDCGTDSVTYEGEVYPTVLIDAQCWFAKNLNVGAIISSAQNQGNYSAGMQKYCYNNNEANCTTNGGLYQWHMAAGKDQSCDSFDCAADPSNTCCTITGDDICPKGWHVPTRSQQNALEQGLTDTPNVCTPNRDSGHWECANAGTKLKADGTNSSDFTALQSGERDTNGGFYDQGTNTWFWLSTITGPDSWFWHLYTGYPTIDHNHIDRFHGFSVRCLKD